MRKLDFKPWEWILIALAALVFVMASLAYVSDYSLRNYFIRSGDEGAGEPVGRLGSKQGGVRREKHGEPEFRSLEAQQPVFDLDTIVTGADGQATLELDGGGIIELSGSSMVQIRFDRSLSLGGITRQAAVEVVTGQVTGRSKDKEFVIRSGSKVVSIARNTTQAIKPKPVVIRAPAPASPRPQAPLPVALAPSPNPLVPRIPIQPSPSPAAELVPRITKLVLTSPKTGARFAPEWGEEKGLPAPRREVAIEWEIVPADAKVQLTVRRREPAVVEMTDLLGAQAGKGRATWVARKPGDYEVVLEEPEAGSAGTALRRASASARFHVDEELRHVELLDPLVGGERTSSNQLTGKVKKDFEILLRWEKIPGVDQYRISVRNDPKRKPVMERMIDRTEFALNRDRVFTGKIYYDVSTQLESGFRLSSRVQPFLFDFLPPRMTLPADRARMSAQSVSKTGVLLVWQKTNFTERYGVQVSRSPDFRTILSSSIRTENFLVVKRLAPGDFYWRVRSLAKKLSSPYSRAMEFTITAP